MKAKITIDASKAIKGIQNIERDLGSVDLAIEDFIRTFKKVALEIKPWQDRTYNLRQQHKISKVQDFEWQLTIDTQLGDPEREEYGQVLEGSSKWRWIKPTISLMKPYAGKMVVDRLNLIIKDF